MSTLLTTPIQQGEKPPIDFIYNLTRKTKSMPQNYTMFFKGKLRYHGVIYTEL